jgi:hypothetical protein
LTICPATIGHRPPRTRKSELFPLPLGPENEKGVWTNQWTARLISHGYYFCGKWKHRDKENSIKHSNKSSTKKDLPVNIMTCQVFCKTNNNLECFLLKVDPR